LDARVDAAGFGAVESLGGMPARRGGERLRGSGTGGESGGLREAIALAIERGRRSGALRSVGTERYHLEEGGVRFLVRVLALLDEKRELRTLLDEEGRISTAVPGHNPFLPYEEDLFVADLSPTHLCLLNKYMVVEGHILVVTRDFEEQEALLGEADFEALGLCLAEEDLLAFYNAGRIAGASQRHRHLQAVPLPLDPEGPRIPLEPLIRPALDPGRLTVCEALPYLHALAVVDADWWQSPSEGAAPWRRLYTELRRAVDLPEQVDAGAAPPYNLLVTREWMLLAPRSRESLGEISVNALGLVGSLLVRDEGQLALLRDEGPMSLLRAVGLRPGG
jgi:ATP adenylyltransferase